MKPILAFACAAFCVLGCVKVPDDGGGGASNEELEPYLGDWHVTGTVTTTCTDGTRRTETLSGPVSFTRGTSSDLIRRVEGSPCPDFPLNVKASNATLVDDVVCPADSVSQLTVKSWQTTPGADDSSATETGKVQTVFPPPETGTCTAVYSTTLVK